MTWPPPGIRANRQRAAPASTLDQQLRPWKDLESANPLVEGCSTRCSRVGDMAVFANPSGSMRHADPLPGCSLACRGQATARPRYLSDVARLVLFVEIKVPLCDEF